MKKLTNLLGISVLSAFLTVASTFTAEALPNNFTDTTIGITQSELDAWVQNNSDAVSENGFSYTHEGPGFFYTVPPDTSQERYEGSFYTWNGQTYFEIPPGGVPTQTPASHHNYQSPADFEAGMSSRLSNAQMAAVYNDCLNTARNSSSFGLGHVSEYEACHNDATLQPDPSFSTEIQDDVTEMRFSDVGGVALKLFRFAMGGANGNGNACITCTFLGNFMLGMATFSLATFKYFQTAFTLIVPVLMMCWIGFKASRMFVTGGDDGRTFLYSIAGRMALFFMVWAAISIEGTGSGSNATPPYAWEMTGPEYLTFAFALSADVREASLLVQNNITTFQPGASPDAFQCSDTVQIMGTFTNNYALLDFTSRALDVACATERTHMIGFASGLAVVFSTTKIDGWLPSLSNLMTALVKVIAGFFLLFVFGLSALWFTFLILDVVVRGMITAAFVPFLAGALLFEKSRFIATSAFKSMAGAVMTAVAIGVVSTLAFFLLTNTVHVYNSLVSQLAPVYSNINYLIPIDDTTVTACPGNAFTTTCAFMEFIVRIQETDPNKPQIPMDLSAPWFYYLVLSGLAIFSLGKKIIAMLEGMMGTQGMSAMADNAMKMARSGMGLGMMAGGIAGTAAMFSARAGGGAVLAKAGAAKGLIDAVNPLTGGSGGGITKATTDIANTLASGAEATNGE